MATWNTPLYNAVKKYASSGPTAFHMPGHKLGKDIPVELKEDLLAIDLTEIPGTDNLHFPEGPIKAAQELAAQAFGADRSFFLVNGSTVGIHAAIMTVCRPEDKLIVARDCHKSVINGLMLAGARPVYVRPEFESSFGISSAVLPSTVEEALDINTDAVGVLITRPNYYGICSDIEEIARIVHSYGKILIVDEAHGAHLKFSDKLPVSALEAGADICIQSAHKTLPAVTQGAYLHVKGGNIDVERLCYNLRVLQTSSPSYIIMVFLDLAREIMHTRGEKLLGNLIENIDQFQEDMVSRTVLPILSQEGVAHGEVDRTRIVVNVSKLGKTGYTMDKMLRKKFNIQVEMADLYNLVCIATVSDARKDFEKLSLALEGFARQYTVSGEGKVMDTVPLKVPPLGADPGEIRWAESISLPLSEAIGKVCLDIITPYPPGVPVICPGEIILEDAVEYIYSIKASGGVVTGLEHNQVRVIV